MKYMLVSKFKWVFVNLKETRFTVCVFTKSTSSWEPGQIISVKAVLQRQWEVRFLYKLCSGCFKLCQAPPLCIHVTFLTMPTMLCCYLMSFPVSCATGTLQLMIKIVQNQNTKSTKQACLSTKVSFIMGILKPVQKCKPFGECIY